MLNLLKNALTSCLVMLAVVLHAQNPATLAMQTDQWNDVVKIYEAATKAKPTDVEAFLRLGSAYQALGLNDKAKAAYTAALGADPKSKLSNVVAVRQALLAGDVAATDKAVKSSEKAARGKDHNLLRALGESFMYGPKKNMAEAEKWLKEAYNAKPKDYETLMQLGYTFRNMNTRLGDAVSNYEYASNLNGTDPLPYYLSAKAYWSGRQPAKYEEYLKKTLDADPTFVPALRDVADYQYFKRRYEDAQISYEKLIKAQGDAPAIEDEMQYSNTLFYLKKYDDVVNQVNKIINKDGSKNYLRRLLGYTYFEKGDTDKGLEVMRDYFQKVAPEKVISRDYEYYGKMLAAKKEDSLALVNLEKAVKMDSSLWQVYGDIGKVKYSRKDYAGAFAAYSIRLDSLGDDAGSNDFYATSLSAYFGADYINAEKYLTKLTEKSPKFGSGWYYLAKTKAKSDPDIAANPALVAEFGKAAAAFEKYLEVAGAETDAAKLEKTKKERIAALEYLSYSMIEKGDKVGGCAKLNAILAIEPTNQSAIEYKASIACP
jgi:tetratricopeptide (TPR) repeat protein